MKHLSKLTLVVFTSALFFLGACSQNREVTLDDKVSDEVLVQIHNLGFSNGDVIRTEGGYIVERDIFISDEHLYDVPSRILLRVGEEEQYRTNNTVTTNGGRNITIHAPVGGSTGYSAGMIAGLDLAIARYNARNLNITFTRVTSLTGANIRMTRLSKRDERQGILGSAGFPTASGNPFGEIKMSGVLESSYGLSVGGIATIIGHEMGHCIGFRHTDYFNRAISCGGAVSNEGASTVGAVHIPGTPTGANPASDLSWMLACTDGSDRPFTGNDIIALSWMYQNNF